MPNQKELNARIALKFDLTENWTNNKSQILLPGEAAFEKTPLNVLKMKVGDGVTDYEHLPYIAGSDQSVAGKEDVTNKVSSFQETPDDTHYPSEKLVKDNLDLKAAAADLATVATSGSYNDLANKPTQLSQFTDNLGSSPVHTHSQYLTSHQDISGKENTSNKVTRWSTITNNTRYPSEKLVKDSLDAKADTSSVPTKVSQLQNDSGYIKQHQDISGKENISNKVSSFSSSPNNTRYPTEKLVYDVTQNLSGLISQLQIKVDSASHIYVGNAVPDDSFGVDGDIFII